MNKANSISFKSFTLLNLFLFSVVSYASGGLTSDQESKFESYRINYESVQKTNYQQANQATRGEKINNLATHVSEKGGNILSVNHDSGTALVSIDGKTHLYSLWETESMSDHLMLKREEFAKVTPPAETNTTEHNRTGTDGSFSYTLTDAEHTACLAHSNYDTCRDIKVESAQRREQEQQDLAAIKTQYGSNAGYQEQYDKAVSECNGGSSSNMATPDCIRGKLATHYAAGTNGTNTLNGGGEVNIDAELANCTGAAQSSNPDDQCQKIGDQVVNPDGTIYGVENSAIHPTLVTDRDNCTSVNEGDCTIVNGKVVLADKSPYVAGVTPEESQNFDWNNPTGELANAKIEALAGDEEGKKVVTLEDGKQYIYNADGTKGQQVHQLPNGEVRAISDQAAYDEWLAGDKTGEVGGLGSSLAGATQQSGSENPDVKCNKTETDLYLCLREDGTFRTANNPTDGATITQNGFTEEELAGKYKCENGECTRIPGEGDAATYLPHKMETCPEGQTCEDTKFAATETGGAGSPDLQAQLAKCQEVEEAKATEHNQNLQQGDEENTIEAGKCEIKGGKVVDASGNDYQIQEAGAQIVENTGIVPEAPEGAGANADSDHGTIAKGNGPCKIIMSEDNAEASISGCMDHGFNRHKKITPESISFTTEGQKTGKVQKIPGSNGFETCQEKASYSWPDLDGQHRSSMFTRGWNKGYEKIMEDVSGKKGALVSSLETARSLWIQNISKCIEAGNCSVEQFNDYNSKIGKVASSADSLAKKIIRTAPSKADSLHREMQECTTAQVILQGTDWNNEDLLDYKNDNGDITKKSMDGKISCRAKGPETLDFLPCARAAMQLDAIAIGKQGLDVYQKFDYQDFSLDQQYELQKDGGQDYKKPLMQQKEGILKQADFAQQRAIAEAAKMALMFSSMASMPDHKSLVKKCKDGGENGIDIAKYRRDELVHAIRNNNMVYGENGKVHVFRTVMNGVTPVAHSHFKSLAAVMPDRNQGQATSIFNKENKYTDDGGTVTTTDTATAIMTIGLPELLSNPENGEADTYSLEEVCNAVIGKDSDLKFGILENTKARDAMKKEMIQAGIDMASFLLQASILKKQADRIDDLLKGIKNFEPIPMTFTGEDLLATMCSPEGFPDHPDCQVIDPRQIYGFADQTFDFGGGGSTSTPTIAEELGGNSDSGNNSSSGKRGSSPRGLGATIGKVDKSAGTLGRGAGASVKKGGGAAGGGGGASGPLGASAPGGGGGGGGGGQQGGSYSPIKVGSYQGGTGGAGYAGGTLGNRTSSKKKSKNPFKKLKGKNSQLTYRGPSGIGSKGSNIFSMISKRYTKVSGDRLLQYKAKQ